MKIIGNYHGRDILWAEYKSITDHSANNCIWLVIANTRPEEEDFIQFARLTIANNIVEFKAHGEFAELLHDLFDETMVLMEVLENHGEIDVVTTWHTGESLADSFWQCFFATSLPAEVDDNSISIVCTDLDGVDRSEELKIYIKEFETGWMPL